MILNYKLIEYFNEVRVILIVVKQTPAASLCIY
jgi:hypothetical protein